MGIRNQTRENTLLPVEKQLPGDGNLGDIEEDGRQIVKVGIFVEVLSIENIDELI